MIALGYDLQDAEKVCTQSLAMLFKPAERVETMLVLGQIMERQRRWEDAVRWFREVCQIEPQHQQAQAQLANAQKQAQGSS